MTAQDHPAGHLLFLHLRRFSGGLAIAVVLVSAMAVPCFGQTVVGTITRAGLVPTAVAVYEAGNKVFVADKGTGNLYIYDGTTLAELGSVNVGEVWGMVVDEAYGKLYATVPTTPLGYNGKLVEVNAATGAFIGQFEFPPNGIYTYCLAYDPGLAKVYVLWADWDTKLAQIDVATDTTASVLLPASALAALEVNPVTHEVFVGNTGGGLLQIVNGITLAKTTGPDDGSFSGEFWGLGVNWIENKLYRATVFHQNLNYNLYNRNTGSVSLIPADNDATVFGFNPTSNRMYTDSEVDAFVTIMDGATDAFWNIGMYGTALGFRLSTNHVYYGPGPNFNYLLDDATQLVEAIPDSDASPTCEPPTGGSYSGVAVNQATGRVFVMNTCFVTVVQDTKELTRPPVYVAAVYLGGESFALHILDPLSKAAVSSSLSYAVYGLAVRPGGGRVYEAASKWFSENGAIRIHAGIGAQTLQTTFEDGGKDPTIPVVTPDGSRLYVTNSASADVSVVDTADNSVVTTVPVGTPGSMPWGAAVTPDGAKVYVANRGNNTVHVISTASNTVSTTLPVGTAPWGVAINPAGTKAYVVNSGSNSVSVIDTASDTVIATVYVGTMPHWLAVSPDGGRIYVTNNGAGTVSVIESGGDTVIDTVPVGNNPEGVAVMPDGSEVYVVNFNASSASSLSVINPSDYSVTPVSLPTNSRGAIPIAIADPTSKFAGRVTNGSCALSGALVRALQGGQEKGTATTNAAGDYSIFNLLPGTYNVEVSTPGYVTQTLTSQSVGAGRTGVLNVVLQFITNPLATLSTTSLDFGSQPLEVTSAPKTVTLSNSGNATLTITSITASGDYARTHNCPSSLGAGSHCTISVTFSPTVAGTRTGAITIADNAAGTPHVVTLTGTGILAPVVALSPTSLSFGNQALGTTSTAKPVKLTNSGLAPLTITSIGTSGNYAQTHNCPSSLAAKAYCTINVTFTPLVAGGQSGTLTIVDNAAGSPHTVRLGGVGLGPVATLSTSSLNFGNQPVGTTSAPKLVNLSNSGNAPLTITSITASGDFAQTSNCVSPLPARTYCTINVTFSPTAGGTRTGAITITDNAAGSPRTVSLTGNGTVPAVTLSPTGLSFGNQALGTTSTAKPVKLTNSGLAPLTITSIGTSGNYAQTNNCVSPLAAKAYCTIQVTFTPTVVGGQSGTLTIVDNAAASPHTVGLGGVGLGPLASVSPTSLNFGNQAVGTTSAPKLVNLSNSGNAPLTISDIAVSGDFGQTNNCVSPLAARTYCTFTVKFAPTAAGTRTGTLTVTDNTAGSPHTVALSGTGTVPAVSLSPTSLSFGNQALGTTSTAKPVKLTNSGLAPLTITSIGTSGNYAQTNNCVSPLAAKAYCTIQVTFTPTVVGGQSGTLTMVDNAAGSPHTVGLGGVGVGPVATLSATSLNVGHQRVGTTSAAKLVNLSNSGNAPLTITSITASGDFAQTNNCVSLLAARTYCTFTIKFTPTAAGTRTGAVSITDNALGSPHTVSLSGTGTTP